MRRRTTAKWMAVSFAMALAITVAVIPRASRMPRAATGSWKLTLIDGHNRPRVELGSATLK